MKFSTLIACFVLTIACNAPTESAKEKITQTEESVLTNETIEADSSNLQDFQVQDLAFQLNNNWLQVGNITYAQNLKGDTVSWQAAFENNMDKSTLDVQFFNNPNGQVLYSAKEKKLRTKKAVCTLRIAKQQK